MRKLLSFIALLPSLVFAQTYTNFPNLQSGNVNFTATIRANGSACASGTAIVSGGGTVSCTAVVPTSQKGAANGVASLDGSGKVPTSQLPFSGLTYDGSWNASTNSPSLSDGTGTSGHFYITSVAGTQNLGSGSISFSVGDWALYNGTVWQKVPSSAAVSSVFGRTGAVTATAGDYTATQVTNTPAGGIAATTVQAAVNELDTDKQASAATLTSWAALTRASGFDTFTQTPSSLNLRGLLTDETGTGLAYFQGGALGTPASATLTNATGLPWSTGLTGVPTTAAGYGITGGAKLDAYAGGDTPSAFTLGIVDSADAATWRSVLGAGTSSFNGDASTLTGTLADARLSSNVPLKNAGNTFTANQVVSLSAAAARVTLQSVGGSGRNWALSSNTDGSISLFNDLGNTALYSNSAGNVIFSPPSSGNAVTITGVSGGAGLVVSGGGGSAALISTAQPNGTDNTFRLGQTGIVNWDIKNIATSGQFQITNGSATPFASTTNGNVTMYAPVSGDVLTLNPAVGGYALVAGKSRIGNDVLATGANFLSLGSDQATFGTAGASAAYVYTNSSARIAVGPNGNTTINAPTASGAALTVNQFGSIPGFVNTSANGQNSTIQLVQTGVSGWNLYNPAGTTDFRLNNGTSDRITVANPGNVTIATPSSGTSLSLGSISGQYALYTPQGAMDAGIVTGTGNFRLYVGTAHKLSLATSGTDRVEVASPGNVTINAPSSGTTITATGAANANAVAITSPNTASQSFGLSVTAGTNASDYGLYVANASGGGLFRVYGDGSVTAGSPTGGPKGASTINTAGDIYVNNSPVCLQSGANCPASGSATSGTWTPSCTTVANSSACTVPGSGQYIRVGNVVTWSIEINVTFTSSGTTTEVSIPPPVASAFTQWHQLTGNITAAAGNSAIQSGGVGADASTDAIRVTFVSGSSTGAAWTYYLNGSYQVL